MILFLIINANSVFSSFFFVAFGRESLVHNQEYLSVAIEDLDAFDAELSDKIRKLPADYLPMVLLPFLRPYRSKDLS